MKTALVLIIYPMNFEVFLVMLRLILFKVLIFGVLFSQINWSHTYGDSINADDGWSIDQTTDGGFILGGMSYYRAILKKINSSGVVEWSRIYEKSEDDNINNVKQTSDGGYIATGYCIDDDTWDYQAWTFKIDSLGEVEWEDVFGSTNKGNTGEDVIETSDGGFVITGNKDNNGDNAKALLRKYSNDGQLLWSQTYSSSNYNEGLSLIETSDYNLVFVGFSGTSHGAYKHFMVKTDSEGNQIWKKRFGNNTQQSLNAVLENTDGSFVATGYTNNYDDLYIVKRNIEGDLDWQKTIDHSDSDDWDTDQGNDIILAHGGGFYILGSTNMYPATAGQDDFWLLKVNSEGDTLWTDVIGGEWWDIGQSLIQIENGNLLLFGTTDSYTSYPENQYDTDFWLISYSPDLVQIYDDNISPKLFQLSNAYPNPFNPKTVINYEVIEQGFVSIDIFDLNGLLVKNIIQKDHFAGNHSITWDGKNESGIKVASGNYFYTLKANNFSETKKVILLK